MPLRKKAQIELIIKKKKKKFNKNHSHRIVWWLCYQDFLTQRCKYQITESLWFVRFVPFHFGKDDRGLAYDWLHLDQIWRSPLPAPYTCMRWARTLLFGICLYHWYSGSNNYLIPCWFCRFAHLQRMSLYHFNHRYIFIIETEYPEWHITFIKLSYFYIKYLIPLPISNISGSHRPVSFPLRRIPNLNSLPKMPVNLLHWLLSSCIKDLYTITFQCFHHGTRQRSCLRTQL